MITVAQIKNVKRNVIRLMQPLWVNLIVVEDDEAKKNKLESRRPLPEKKGKR